MPITTVWIEIPANDVERAAKFYQAVFGAEYTIHDDGTRRTATLTNSSDQGPGFSVNQTANFEPNDKGPLVYLMVPDGYENTDLLDRVTAAGGKVLTPKTFMEGAGYYTLVRDSEGNVLALYSVH